MSVIDSPQAIKTDPAIELALLINADELVRFVVFVAAIDLEIHAQLQIQVTINSFISLLEMSNPHQERVEFFHSESSFGSDSELSQSRYYDFTNQIVADCENVFLTLKRELHPIENQTQQDKIEFAIRRAQIMQMDTIPEHKAYLRKVEAPQNARQQVDTCSEKLFKLLADYDGLRKGQIAYKQFYTTYGKEFGLNSTAFSRKKDVIRIETDSEDVIRPEYIQINYTNDRQKLKGATPRVFASQAANGNEKEHVALREEVHRLKKINEEDKKKYEITLANERLNFEKRMKAYLNSQYNPSEVERNLRQEVNQTSEKLSQSLEESKNLQQMIEQRGKMIENLNAENADLREQIERLRKTDNNLYEQQDPNRSYNSETNENTDKRNEKRIRNLLQENELLKSQLKSERQKQYRLQSDLSNEERRELQRLKRLVEKKDSQLEELQAKYDQHRVEVLHLTHSSKAAEKMLESLKRQNEQLQKKTQFLSESGVNHIKEVKEERTMQVSRAVKTQVSEYEGVGIEGYPYYETLGKEFKIRFRRACLKEKQLLYKSSSVEIGVISTFERPNKLVFLVHLTNISEHRFEKVRVKIMNANENKVHGEFFEYSPLVENEQVKMPVSVSLTQYPIGPVILLLQYQGEKKEEVRILLPSHVFKTLEVEDRKDSIHFANSTRSVVVAERKVLKELSDLRQYFKLGKGSDVKVSLFHEHTHTLFFLDANPTKDGLELIIQHKEGNRNITEYFHKTFSFLLSKEAAK